MIDRLIRPLKPDRFPTRLLLGIFMAYWIWMLFDLLMHPVAAGPNEGGSLFRWISALTGVLTVLTALFVMRRVPGNPVGPLLLLWGIGATGWSLRSEWVNMQVGTLATLAFALIFFCISCPAAILLLILFPDGKPYPLRLARWLPLFAGLLVVAGSFYLFGHGENTATGDLHNPLFIPALKGTGQTIYIAVFLMGMTTALVTLALRYRSGDERLRLQIRWLAWLLSVGILLGIVPFESLFGPEVALSVLLIAYIFWQSFLALGIGIAMLRHNLWQVDVIIRKTLLYTILTVLLALAYFGSVVLMLAVLGPLVGQATEAMPSRDTLSAPVAVGATLIVAALFTPLRRRIQDVIDRRFYRRKYDAAQVLARFSQTARQETDLDNLTVELARVVQETMQPERVSVWLRKQ